MPAPPALSAEEYRQLVRRTATLLSGTSDFCETLEQTLLACLPQLGDFGFFDARAGYEVTRVARAYQDEATEAILRPTRWIRQERSDMNLCALSTGEPAIHPQIDDRWYQAVASSPEHLAVLRRLAFRSMITVPMRHAGELIGALTLFMGSSGRRHDLGHLEVARDLAGIAAPVVANAAMVERYRESEGTLRAAQQRMQLAIHAGGLGAWEWLLESGAVYWSPEYREIYGLPMDEPPSFEKGMAAVVADDRAMISQVLEAAAASGDGFNFQHRIMHPERGLRWIQTLGRAQVEEGRTVRMHGVVLDVTERKRQEEEVRDLRDRLSAELGAVRRLHGISTRVIRREDRLDELLQEILEAALEITGRSQGSIRLVDEERGVMRIVAHKGFRSEFFDRFDEIPRAAPMASAAAWRSGRRIVIENTMKVLEGFEGEGMAALRAAGVRALQATPLISRDGRIIGVFSTHSHLPQAWNERELRMLDLLSREAADLIERAQSQAMLNESDRRKNEFLAILAHELRNPLAPLRYAISIARERSTSPDQATRALEVMERQVRHMARLLDDLLDISRIERGTVQLRKSLVSMTDIVAGAREAARPLLEAKQHRISVSLPEGETLLMADPVRLTQVLTNLLSNAAKYSDPGGEISIEVSADEAAVRIVVRDQGIGISEDVRPRLFKLFAQGDGAAQRGEGGLGIGLALVQAFVELHGGRVDVRSAGIGKGSEFEVVLPAASAELRPVVVREQHAPPPQRRLKVVIADDNRDILETCSMLVGLWGHEAHTAADGADALDTILRVRPDVALLDIGMPRMSGHQVAARVRQELGESMFLVAVTGWGQDDARRQSQSAGFNAHLTKPLEPGELARVFDKAATTRRVDATTGP